MGKRALFRFGVGLALLAGMVPAGTAQSRIKEMPGYERWSEMAPKIPTSVELGRIEPEWAENSRSFTYELNNEDWRFDLRSRQNRRDRGGDDDDDDGDAEDDDGAEYKLVLARGRGADADVESPDGKMRAFSRDHNVWVSDADGENELALSTDGNIDDRVRNGVGSYVYLEEFGVRSPVWWSPDSRKVAWMRYDEAKVGDYFLALDQSQLFSKVLTQAYPHPGEDNPVADLLVHDLDTGETVWMDVRDGAPFSDDIIGHYVWDAVWAEDSEHVLIRRADRLQKTHDVAACNISTGACKDLVRETRIRSWARTDAPYILEDGRHFIWASERSGFKNFYLYGLDGKMKATLTRHAFDVEQIIGVDEKRDELWYTARSGDNYMKLQLHRVGLDGRGERSMTDPTLTHRVYPAPDFSYFVDVAEAHDIAPMSQVLDRNGKHIAGLVNSVTKRFEELGLRHVEMFTYTSADGETPLTGAIHYPSDFDASKKYPVLLSVYGGPESNRINERFKLPDDETEFGFVIVQLDARSMSGVGRKVLDGFYQQLGIWEIDDFAAALKQMRAHEWFDPNRVGVFGTSYGGTVAALLPMRYPDLVQAAVSNSPVSDFRLYDTAYTERYLGLPADSPEAYDQVAVLTYVDQLEADLLLYFGTSDDNVHPKNSLQLIDALNAAGKSYEVQVGPDRGHTRVNDIRMMEFFIERLVMER